MCIFSAWIVKFMGSNERKQAKGEKSCKRNSIQKFKKLGVDPSPNTLNIKLRING